MLKHPKEHPTNKYLKQFEGRQHRLKKTRMMDNHAPPKLLHTKLIITFITLFSQKLTQRNRNWKHKGTKEDTQNTNQTAFTKLQKDNKRKNKTTQQRKQQN